MSDLSGKKMGKDKLLKRNPGYEKAIEGFDTLSICPGTYCEATCIPRDTKEGPLFPFIPD